MSSDSLEASTIRESSLEASGIFEVSVDRAKEHTEVDGRSLVAVVLNSVSASSPLRSGSSPPTQSSFPSGCIPISQRLCDLWSSLEASGTLDASVVRGFECFKNGTSWAWILRQQVRFSLLDLMFFLFSPSLDSFLMVNSVFNGLKKVFSDLIYF